MRKATGLRGPPLGQPGYRMGARNVPVGPSCGGLRVTGGSSLATATVVAGLQGVNMARVRPPAHVWSTGPSPRRGPGSDRRAGRRSVGHHAVERADDAACCGQRQWWRAAKRRWGHVVDGRCRGTSSGGLGTRAPRRISRSSAGRIRDTPLPRRATRNVDRGKRHLYGDLIADPLYASAINRELNIVTPENEMKRPRSIRRPTRTASPTPTPSSTTPAPTASLSAGTTWRGTRTTRRGSPTATTERPADRHPPLPHPHGGRPLPGQGRPVGCRQRGRGARRPPVEHLASTGSNPSTSTWRSGGPGKPIPA